MRRKVIYTALMEIRHTPSYHVSISREELSNTTILVAKNCFYCPYEPRLGIITAENRPKYSAILCLVSCSLTPKFSNPVFNLIEDRIVIHRI